MNQIKLLMTIGHYPHMINKWNKIEHYIFRYFQLIERKKTLRFYKASQLA
ncbi:MAG: hypothetical protein HF967_04500 [Methanosarcinales archaeon]|nr:hypothetical protein [Methanosarcinales archaeon]